MVGRDKGEGGEAVLRSGGKDGEKEGRQEGQARLRGAVQGARGEVDGAWSAEPGRARRVDRAEIAREGAIPEVGGCGEAEEMNEVVPPSAEVLEQQIENLRGRVAELEGTMRFMAVQLQLVVQMALRHDWTLGEMTGGRLCDREMPGTVDNGGVLRINLDVPAKNWAAVLVPRKQSRILTARSERVNAPSAVSPPFGPE